MAHKANRSGGEGLERSCAARPGDWFRTLAPADGVELLEAWFAGRAYDKHRHDSYAIGLTDSGVQSFSYRGARQCSTPGKVIVLYPDEVHDGQAGSDQGFGYRMLYIEPSMILDALQSLSKIPPTLPFLPDAVSTNPTLSRAIASAFHDSSALPSEPLALDNLVLRLAEGLVEGDPGYPDAREPRHLDRRTLDQVRQRLNDEQARVVRSSELEAMTGLTRYELARQFRALYGTSPYRYLLMRRLASARNELARSQSLADLAVATGFSDQAHFTRMFKSAFGVTPGRYRALLRRQVPEGPPIG